MSQFLPRKWRQKSTGMEMEQNYVNNATLHWYSTHYFHFKTSFRKMPELNWLYVCHPNHTHTHLFNGPLSGTTQVSRYQKGKTNLDFTEAITRPNNIPTNRQHIVLSYNLRNHNKLVAVTKFNNVFWSISAFSALTLLVGRQEGTSGL